MRRDEAYQVVVLSSAVERSDVFLSLILMRYKGSGKIVAPERRRWGKSQTPYMGLG
jgi:hypothetical protein